jgi:hypothetical protein
VQVVASVPLYPPRSRVGAWLATHQFLRELVGRGHHVAVCTYLASDPGYELDGVQVHPAIALEQLARRADVLVAHAASRVKLERFTARTGAPLVRIVHGAPSAGGSVDDAALVVYNSEATARAWTAPGIVCHPPTFPEDHLVPATGGLVTQVNLARHKGGALFRLLVASLPERRFLGVLGAYGAQVRADLPHLELWPVQSDMRTVWAQTRIMLMPSESETWGMVAVEAACAGIPVISSPTDGVLEALGPGALYAEVGDLAGWRSTIAELDDPEFYAARVAAGREAVAQLDPHGSMKRFGDAVESLTMEVLP